MEWVHCNSCYIQPGDEEKKEFFVTNCGHIYCSECLRVNQSNECRICHVKYITIPLGANMNPDVEVYFQDPAAILKKLIKVLEFQQSHRVQLTSHLTRNNGGLKKENYNLSERLKLSQEENLILKNEFKRIKTDYYELKKKHEIPEGGSQLTPRLESFGQFLEKENRRTPIAAIYQEKEALSKFSPTVDRTPKSNFFKMTEAEPARKAVKVFKTPQQFRFPGTYRSLQIMTPDLSKPGTPDSVISECSQRNPLQRRIKLPESRCRPSPLSRYSFQGPTLSRLTSTSNKKNVVTRNI